MRKTPLIPLLSVLTVILVTLTLCEGLTSTGLLCLNCDRVIQPRDCKNVVRCGQHEVLTSLNTNDGMTTSISVCRTMASSPRDYPPYNLKCMVEKTVSSSGVVWYNVGCESIEFCSRHGQRRSSFTMCSQCCNSTTLCNREGCGSHYFDSSLNYKTCYSCEQQAKPDTCDQIELCGLDQHCGITKEVFGTDTIFETGCFSISKCGTVSHGKFIECCNGSLCNDKVSDTTTQSPTTSTTTQHTTSMGTGICPSGWINGTASERYCYHKAAGTFSWQDAKILCMRFGTHLPIIVEKQQLDVLSAIIGEADVWLDGTDIVHENSWVWSTTGAAVSQLFWAPNMPDHYYGIHSENCLEFGKNYGLLYNDAPCSRHLNVICEDGKYNTDFNVLIDCPSGNWVTLMGSMYCVVNNVKLDWFQSKNFCLNLHSHLPIVDSESKLNQLQGLIGHQGEIWLDGTEKGHHNSWTWSYTGQPITYTRWLAGEPNDYAGNLEECMEFGEVYGWFWNDAPCDDSNRITRIVCERPITQVSNIFGRK